MLATPIRQKEYQQFNKVLKDTNPQMLALYGRRRIGKTYTARDFFSKQHVYFEVTGLKDGSMQLIES